ncbi:MAG: hypothetical protein KUG63_02060, partial [Cycloclasticus sp.]|nr:hypothetical protein [Cycloclasticus sp.]
IFCVLYLNNNTENNSLTNGFYCPNERNRFTETLEVALASSLFISGSLALRRKEFLIFLASTNINIVTIRPKIELIEPILLRSVSHSGI